MSPIFHQKSKSCKIDMEKFIFRLNIYIYIYESWVLGMLHSDLFHFIFNLMKSFSKYIYDICISSTKYYKSWELWMENSVKRIITYSKMARTYKKKPEPASDCDPLLAKFISLRFDGSALCVNERLDQKRDTHYRKQCISSLITSRGLNDLIIRIV